MAGPETQAKAVRRRVTWMHIVLFAFATAISYVLAVVSSLIFPVLGAPGVSALYLAAAIYVPLGIWMGMWGCLAGYISCFFLGLYPSGYTLIQSFIWSWADFIEALLPFLIFKALAPDPDFTPKRPGAAKLLPWFIAAGTTILFLGVVVQLLWGATYGEPFTTIYAVMVYLGLALACVGIAMGLIAGHARTWLATILSVIAASFGSGIWGAGTLTLWNLPPPLPAELFWPVFVGWVTGDLIVLSVISTALLVALTPIFKRTGLFVRGWWA
ncbi:MAG: hypothetical protein QXP94_03325 [Thermofilaceae archaeon]